MSQPPQGGGGASPPNGRHPLWKAAGWIWSILGKIFKGLLIGVGAGIILAFMAPMISENIAYVNPTCDEPRGLRVIPSTDIKVDGPTYEDEDEDEYPPENVLDGDPGSMWAPLQQLPEEERPGLVSRVVS
jgi:hypothetical protein